MSEALKNPTENEKVLDFQIPEYLFYDTFSVPKLERHLQEIAKLLTADEAKRQELIAALREVCRRAQQGEELLPSSPRQAPMLPPRRGPDGKLILPELPAGLAWPTETYSGSPEAKRGGGGIVAFLERVWGPHIAAGAVSRVVLREIDRTADQAVANYLHSGKQLPDKLLIPAKKELNDRAIAAFQNAGDRPVRLQTAIRARDRRTRASQSEI